MKEKRLDLSHQKGVLGRNTLINILGQGIPLLFALLALPFVINGLGTERFGVLVTIWVVTGYFSLFDMGLGRATTKFLADEDARGGDKSYPIIFTSILLLTGLGFVGTLIVFLLTPWLIGSFLNIPADLVDESKYAFYILSLSIPFVLGSLAVRGVLEARQRFGIVNAVKIPASLINYVGPVPVLLFSNSLVPLVSLLVAARIVTYFIYLYFSLQGEKLRWVPYLKLKKWAEKLFGFGAWLTVSNVISPIMVYMDRFIIGAILTMSAVTYYTTPYEVVSRLLIISGSFMGVMFPAFSVYSKNDPKKLIELIQSSVRYLMLALAPVILFIILSSESLLYYWLGNEFSENSTVVMQVLALGMLFNSLAMIPFTALQAYGRPDILAKIHMVELPLYLGMIWYFTHLFGINGVAMAWTIRVALDGLLIIYFFNRFVPVLSSVNKLNYSLLGILLIFFAGGMLVTIQIENHIVMILLSSLVSIILFFFIWIKLMKTEEKTRIWKLIYSVREMISR